MLDWVHHHADTVHDAAGRFAGVACHTGYSDGRLLSLAMLRPEQAEIGSELTVTWEEPDGGSRKPQVERHVQTVVRAVVAPAPFAAAGQQLQRTGLTSSA